jgi:hypothetical protein
MVEVVVVLWRYGWREMCVAPLGVSAPVPHLAIEARSMAVTVTLPCQIGR